MSRPLVVILGGTRSGKSRFGRQLYSGLGDFLAQIYRARIANFVRILISRVRSLVRGLRSVLA